MEIQLKWIVSPWYGETESREKKILQVVDNLD